MKNLLILLLFPIFVSGQTLINETFNSFICVDTTHVKGHWIFDDTYHSDIRKDTSGKSNDLTVGANFDYINQMTGNNPAFEDGNAVELDGINDYFYIPAAQAGDFNPGTGDFTIEMLVYRTKETNFLRFFFKGDGTSDISTKGYSVFLFGNGVMGLQFKDGVENKNYSNIGTIPANTWTYIAFVFERDSDLSVYLNNNDAVTYSIAVVQGDISPNNDFIIGTNASKTQSFGGYIAGIRYSDIVRTAKEIKESYALAKNWYSKAGGVSRSNLEFHQGIVNDTVYTVIPDKSKQKWQLQFDAWSASGTPDLNYFTSALGGTQTVTTGSTRYTINLGAGNFINDSLYFHTTSTIYIDNVIIKKYKRGYSKFKGYGGY